MTIDYTIFTIAVMAVVMTGLSKGGLAGGISMLGTPLLALHLPPLQAVSVMLPMLMVLDFVSVYSYRHHIDRNILWSMLPFGALGILIGWLTASMINANGVRITIGIISIVFAISGIYKDFKRHSASKPSNVKAAFWGTVSGLTSFLSHAGGPPYQAYTLPLRMEKLLFVGTGAVYFTTINLLKWPAYFALGELNAETLKFSAMLIPFGLAGIFAGIWITKRLSQHIFYRLTYLAMLVVGSKLIWDGIGGI